MSVEKILNKMKQNKRDWSIPKLLTVANKLDITYSNYKSSHYVFKYPGIIDNLSIPANKKDIHPDYITKFIRLVEQVLELQVPQPSEEST